MLHADLALSSFDNARLLVVGDLMLDQYTWAGVERISPEAPVMVLQAQQEEVRLGGAASVAALLAGLDVRASVAGVIGDDPAGRIVQRLLAERHRAPATPARAASSAEPARPKPRKTAKSRRAGDGDGCCGAGPSQASCRPERRDLYMIDPNRPTTVKERLLGLAENRGPHQILRLDRECCRPIERELERRMASLIGGELTRCQAVLISDYAKGVCTPGLVAAVIRRARDANIPVLVDPGRGADFGKYRGAALIKANRHEAQFALGAPILDRRQAFAAAREMCRKWELHAAVITLDRDGVVMAMADGACRRFDAQVREVCDVTGAGDTVFAVLGACLAAGMALADAVRLANVAATLQIQKIGVGQIERDELRKALEDKPRCDAAASPLCHGKERHLLPSCTKRGKRPGSSKVVSRDELLELAEKARQCEMRIVLANGCFDLLHVGHVTCLEQAAALGDVLFVAVNSDRSVRRLKGTGRPVINQKHRAAMVAALQAVDRVMILEADDPCELLQELKPDVLVKGGGYRLDQVVGREIVEAYGGRVRLVDQLQGISTTHILESLHSR